MGRGSSISAPSTPRPSGRWPIAATCSGGIPTWMNASSPPCSATTPSAPYRASTSSTAACTIRFEHHRKVEGLHDGLRGAQQRPEPVLRLHHLAGAIHQFVQRTVELGPGRTGDGS